MELIIARAEIRDKKLWCGAVVHFFYREEPFHFYFTRN